MNILIVSATFNEIKLLFEKTKLLEKEDEYFSKHSFEENKIDFLITGVGMTSTAYRMGKILSGNHYDYALNLGIAGVFKKHFKIGEVVNVCSDMISELGAEQGSSFINFEQLNMNDAIIKKTIWQTKNKYEINNSVLQLLPKAKGITVNTVHGNNNSIEKIIQKLNPDVESMEGQAFLYICNEEKLKCAQIRAISNDVEERNFQNWNIKLAIENLNDIAFRILTTLTK